MTSLQPLLESIGFNHHESGIYLHLLGKPGLAASVIARELRLPRSTVRGTLDHLCAINVVTKVYRKNTQFYSCKSPEMLERYLEKKVSATTAQLARIQRAVPLFSALHNHPDIVPKVQVFEGAEQVIEAFNHSLYVDGIEEILFMTSYRFLRDPIIKKNDFEFYIPRRVKKGIRMRVLVGQADNDDIPKRNDKRELRERRELASRHVLLGNLHIYGNFVVYFSAGDQEYLAVLVESAIMADTIRSLFNAMWEQCPA